tara:strand:+ start:6497 stop:8236 length:1740 start_codon:yes stop_codon:yes gene_type:complete
MTEIVAPSLALAALREAGYRNTASAVAELVDNAIEAQAKSINIIAVNQEFMINVRRSTQISMIAVVDDGCGMEPETLQKCLSLGWGTRLERYEGLGRFGFGLKGSSISQARRVDVYSWQEDGEILRTYLDLDEIEEKQLSQLPEIEPAQLPKGLKQYLESESLLGNSGTVVIWSKLDKIDLRRSDTLLRRMNQDLCRIYRHFLDDDDQYGKRVEVKLHSISEQGERDTERGAQSLKANDPLYMLTPNNCPDFESQATNELQDEYELDFHSPRGPSKVKIRCSIANPDIQALGGGSSVGKHYARNTGISVVRAGREIQLSDFGFIDSSEPRHRWWGLEVRFEPALDEVFGITNNKQEARALRRLGDTDIESLEADAADSDEHDKAVLKFRMELSKKLKEHIDQSMKVIKGRREGARSQKKQNNIVKIVNDEVTVDPSATVSADLAQGQDDDTKVKERAELLLKADTTLLPEQAREIAEETLDYRIDIQTANWPGDLFLDTKVIGNAAVAIVNRDHPFYDSFWDLLERADDQKGFEALEVLLMAYCRAEDELATRMDRENFEQLRNRWGSWVRQLIRHAGS